MVLDGLAASAGPGARAKNLGKKAKETSAATEREPAPLVVTGVSRRPAARDHSDDGNRSRLRRAGTF